MKLVVNLKLLPTTEQADLLRATLERCNQACDWISEQGWRSGILRQYDLHKLIYAETRTRFELSSQVTVRCIAKVADAYKLDRSTQRHFRSHAAQPYDERIFGFKSDTTVSIWVLTGRAQIPFVCGERQRALLAFRKGEVDLMFVRGKWYLAVVCDVDEPDLIETTDVLGVDLGIVNLAVDSNGTTYSGDTVAQHRRRHAHRRRNLQRNGSRSATRKLRRISGKERRYQRDVNHCVSKVIVAEAQRTECAIALEELTGIRTRVTAKRPQRARLSAWAFHQLRQFVTYKARLVGVPVIPVEPRNTSRECPACGLIDKRNRRTRDEFLCVGCGFSGPADHVAGINIRQRALISRAVVNQPMASGSVAHASAS